MRRLAFFAAAALTSAALAQSPLTTLAGGTNSGNPGGGIYFDLEVSQTITINQIDFRCGANTVAGSSTFDLFMGPGTYLGQATTPSQWVLVTSCNTVPVAASTVASGVLATPLGLAPGRYGIALRAATTHAWGYTNGVACASTTTPGACSNSNFSTAELRFLGGAASNTFQTLPTFQPRVFNGAFHYTLGGTPTPVASWQAIGAGCYGRWTSFYEVFANPAGLDFGNIATAGNVGAMRLSLNGNSYSVSASSNTLVAPSGSPHPFATITTAFSASTALGTALPFPIVHPSASGVTPSNDLQISPTGYIVPGTTAIAVDTTPTAPEVLSGPIRWMPHWKSMLAAVPVAPSGIYVENDVVNSELRVTYNAIADRGGVSTFQVVFYPTGDVEYRYDVMSLVGGGTYPVIVGWTVGGGALDRGSIDITAALPFVTGTLNNPPLTLACQNRPLIGTNPVLQITNHEATQPVGFLMLDLVGAPAGIPLVGFGMPECSAYVQLASSLTNLYVVSPVTNVNFPIPNSSSYNGVVVHAQAAAIGSTFNTAFGVGANTSNGVLMRVGSL